MSALRIITLVIGLSVSAEANPLAFMARTRAYLSSEHLSVTISGKEAQIRSTFTFRFEPDRLDYIKEMGGVEIELPIWIPDNDAGNGGIAEFWKTFGTFFLNGLGEKNRPQFDDTVSLSATLGSQGLAAQRLMSYSSHLDPRVLTTYASQMKKPEFLTFKLEGGACVIATLTCQAAALRGDAPLTVSYRQPLITTSRGLRFVYLPSFYSLPPGVSTADTNRFSITMSAGAGCALQVTNGDQQYALAPEHRIVLSPRHLQPIRATLRAGSNQTD